MIGEIVKGGAAAIEARLEESPLTWPCWDMDVRDVWLVPQSVDRIVSWLPGVRQRLV